MPVQISLKDRLFEMFRIQQLSTSVVNKIAAGEVIERPASVVKELLENSIDALATRIEVDAVNGGGELIRIVDDGEGIHPDDLLLAVTSHATSKIRDAEDLFEVQTMGFRGEALASVAEVSRLRIRTRQADQQQGRELCVDLGKITPPRECGCPLGTQIEIRNLFENTPVRRKFLKTVSTEFGHISEQFARIALAHPRLHMVLRHNEKLVYELPASEKPLDRLKLFFGRDLTEGLIPVESEQAGVKMWGYVGHPNNSKTSRKQQYLFLNGRWIQDRSLQYALTDAYRGLLMVGRQPIHDPYDVFGSGSAEPIAGFHSRGGSDGSRTVIGIFGATPAELRATTSIDRRLCRVHVQSYRSGRWFVAERRRKWLATHVA